MLGKGKNGFRRESEGVKSVYRRTDKTEKRERKREGSVMVGGL